VQCCSSALASAQVAINDANLKSGLVVPELGTLTKDVQLQLGLVFDSSDKVKAIDELRGVFADSSVVAKPVAVVGSFGPPESWL